MRSPEELSELFRSRGLKVTPQRLCVFRALHGAREHPSAEAVHALVRTEMPTVSLRTVYQALNDLTAMGEVGQLDLGSGATRFDPNLDPHHHLVCDRCGRVRDVHGDFAHVQPPDGHDHGYRTSSTEIVFRGLCPVCQAADDEALVASTGRARATTRPSEPTPLHPTPSKHTTPSTHTTREVTNHG